MTMVIDNQSRHYGAMGYENMYSGHLHSPEFNNPWATSNSNNAPATYSSMPKHENSRPNNISMPFSQLPASAPTLASGSNYSTAGYGGSDLLSLSQDIPRTYGTENSYTSTSPANNSYAPPQYSSIGYSQSLQQQQQQQHIARKLSNPNENSRAAHASFGELDASRGMLALSHQNLADLTPRNIYEARNPRAATDSYGFPQTHSAHSSISAASSRDYPYSYGGSIASADSATDYSSAASESGYDSVAVSRTLPRPNQLVGANLSNIGPPAPQSMMGQFSSKMSSNTQKKHKCKVCDKRFTRPSSLQTHMYSHTGEKPFACNVEGCGRHFSVVSNLRRHKKVHKGESVSSHSDDDE